MAMGELATAAGGREAGAVEGPPEALAAAGVRHAELMQRMAAAFARQDVAAITACFAEDGVFETSEGPHPWGERFTGRAAIGQAVEGVFALLADIRFEEASHWAWGEQGVAEWTCRFTTPKGRAVAVQGCDLFTFRNGLVLRKSSFFKRVIPPRQG